MNKIMTFFALMFLTCNFLCMVVEGGGFAVTRLDNSAYGEDGILPADADEVTVVNMNGFLTNVDADHLGQIVINGEIISYPDVVGKTFTGCIRGTYDLNTLAQGTEAAAHNDGSKVMTLNVSAIDSFVGYNITTSTATFGAFEAIKFVAGMFGGFFGNLPRMLVWDYPFFDGMLVYVRYFLFALSIGFVFSIVMGMVGLAQGIMRMGG